MSPEQEDVEWHSDRIPLSTDPDGLQHTGVSQLTADQVVLKHAWLLNTDVKRGHSEAGFMHANDRYHQEEDRMPKNLPSYYLA